MAVEEDDPPIVSSVPRRSVDLLKSDKLAIVTPFNEQEKKNAPNIKGSHSWPLSPPYASVPTLVASHHNGEMQYHTTPRRDTPFSVLFRPGSIQLKLFQYLNARDIMTLCATDCLVRRHTRTVLSRQTPPPNPEEPISIQDIRPHHYPSDERCDAILSFDVGPLQANRFASSISLRSRGTVYRQESNCWHSGAAKFAAAVVPPDRNPHLPRPEAHFMRRKYMRRPDLYERWGRRDYADTVRGHPKIYPDFLCCRRAQRGTQYEASGEPMVSCFLCTVDARTLLEWEFISMGWWRPVCLSCHNKAHGFYPNGYQSCHCIEPMITETCWACIDRIMAEFERREYDTRQRFPEKIRRNDFIYPFRGIMDFFQTPGRSYRQIRLRLDAFWERGRKPRDPNTYCWPVCPCGEQISRTKGEYPNGVLLPNGMHIANVLGHDENG